MKYAVEKGSTAMIYIPGFIAFGSGIQNLIGRIHRQQGDLIILLWGLHSLFTGYWGLFPRV
jgi:hypothetical protein